MQHSQTLVSNGEKGTALLSDPDNISPPPLPLPQPPRACPLHLAPSSPPGPPVTPSLRPAQLHGSRPRGGAAAWSWGSRHPLGLYGPPLGSLPRSGACEVATLTAPTMTPVETSGRVSALLPTRHGAPPLPVAENNPPAGPRRGAWRAAGPRGPPSTAARAAGKRTWRQCRADGCSPASAIAATVKRQTLVDPTLPCAAVLAPVLRRKETASGALPYL